MSDVAVSRYQARRHRHPLSLVCRGQAWCETLPVQCSPAVYCAVLYCTVLYCAGVMCKYGRVKGHPTTLGTTLTFGPAIYYIYIYVDYLLLTALHCTAQSTTYLLNIKILFYSFTLGHSSGETETSCR